MRFASFIAAVMTTAMLVCATAMPAPAHAADRATDKFVYQVGVLASNP